MIVPPWASTIACEIASPSPSPPNCCGRLAPPLLEGVEDAGQDLGGDADAGVGRPG